MDCLEGAATVPLLFGKLRNRKPWLVLAEDMILLMIGCAHHFLYHIQLRISSTFLEAVSILQINFPQRSQY